MTLPQCITIWTNFKTLDRYHIWFGIFLSQFINISKCVWCWVTVFLLLMLCQVAKHKSIAMFQQRFWETKEFHHCHEWQLHSSSSTTNNRNAKLCNNYEISASFFFISCGTLLPLISTCSKNCFVRCKCRFEMQLSKGQQIKNSPNYEFYIHISMTKVLSEVLWVNCCL